MTTISTSTITSKKVVTTNNKNTSKTVKDLFFDLGSIPEKIIYIYSYEGTISYNKLLIIKN